MSYDTDFYDWTKQQAALLRSGDLSGADLQNIAEEIESMGKSEKRELRSRLTILLLHMLKWTHQPEKRVPSWEATIRVQRPEITEHLDENPSLKHELDESITRAYKTAREQAAGETGLPRSTFPLDCPWTFDEMINEDHWP
jgi:hypothetical protein